MSAAHPSREAMLAWLVGPDVVAADGRVASWSNAAHPGYAYPEAAGLLLSLLSLPSRSAGPPSTDARPCDAIAATLARDVSARGGVGRDGRDYLFDTAIALAGLLSHEHARGRSAPSPIVDPLFAFVADAVATRRAVVPDEAADSHWSRRFGAHHLKLAIVLARVPRGAAIVDDLVRELVPLCAGGRVRIHAQSSTTYLHAACYAVEGLLAVDRHELAALRAVVDPCAAWLASVQREDGGLPAWHDGAHGSGEARADVAAQAVRIWACVDRQAFAREITRALAFLARLQHPSGGLRYHADSDDVNTWATIFAVQALDWAEGGADARLLV